MVSYEILLNVQGRKKTTNHKSLNALNIHVLISSFKLIFTEKLYIQYLSILRHTRTHFGWTTETTDILCVWIIANKMIKKKKHLTQLHFKSQMLHIIYSACTVQACFTLSFQCLVVAMGTQKQQVTLNLCLCRNQLLWGWTFPNPTVLSLLG